jgi:hypothetical protein
MHSALSRHARNRVATAAAAAVLGVTTVVSAVAAPSQAATSSSCADGGFRVTMPNGTAVSGTQSAKISTGSLPADSLISVRGRYVEFDFAPVTGNIYNYVYTGAANPDSLTNGVRTPIWESKTLSLGPVLRTEVEARPDGTDLVILARGKSGKVKIQAKDCATGGIFQQEVEAGTTVRATHTLAANMYYFVNPYTGKVNFGDGSDFRGKDSPQVATKVSQSDRVTVWDIASGGRMGQVLGEDAVELSAGATNCVEDCQAQNRIRGSLPVTDPAFSG